MLDCPKTVFVVEDDADVGDSLNAVIMSLGYSCRVFESAETLFEQGNVSDCGFLVIDVDLPGMQGTELLTILRQSGSQTPAVFYTGRIDQQTLDVAVALGDVPVFQKGTDIAKLVERLKVELSCSDEATS